MTVPDPTPIYHITHIDNLRSIIQHSAILSHNLKIERGIGHQDISHDNIQDRRARTLVPCGPRGCLHDYTPFFFCPRPPMLYSIHHGYVEGYEEGQEPVVHLVTTAQAVVASGCNWVFTDGHGTMAFTDFYDELDDLSEIDWAIVHSNYWFDTPEQPDRKRRKQAEFLIRDSCPWTLISEIGVVNSDMKRQVRGIIGNSQHQPSLRVRRGWYY